MNAKRFGALALAALSLAPTLLFASACSGDDTVTLRVFNWEEYIDEGGEGSYQYDYEVNPDGSAPPIVEDFEQWYEEVYGTPIRVEYSTFGTNEDMYNQIQLGDEYDLLCPSEYMIMKLAAEDYLQPYDESFFDVNDPHNYYIRNVSPYIKEMFESNRINKEDADDPSTWADYAAGYMWGVTGFTYNPAYIRDESVLRELGWDIMLEPAFKNKVTTKDNVRDSYFVALAICYRDEIESLDKTDPAYGEKLAEIMNRTDDETIRQVEAVMREMDENIYGYETDTGKADIVSGKIWLNFAWSGDAVYAILQPSDLKDMEDDEVLISRAKQSITYPASFMLAAAMNPCPCGFLGDSRNKCDCSPYAVNKYVSKISGPILDRIDIQIEVSRLQVAEFTDLKDEESSRSIRERVIRCREFQKQRMKNRPFISNSKLPEPLLKETCKTNAKAKKLILKIMENSGFTARTFSKILRTARTIADLEEKEIVEEHHIAEAAQYRNIDRTKLKLL